MYIRSRSLCAVAVLLGLSLGSNAHSAPSQTVPPGTHHPPGGAALELARGDRLSAQWTASALEAASIRYAAAASLCRTHNDLPCLRSSLFHVGLTREHLGLTKPALAAYHQAASLFDAASCDETYTDTRIHIATLLIPMAQYTEAKTTASAALSCSQTSSDHQRIAAALNALAAVAYYQASLDEALHFLDRAAAALPGDENTSEQATTHLFRSYIFAVHSSFSDAIDQASQANAIAQSAADPRLQAAALQVLGSYYLQRGELRRARAAYYQALNLAVKVGDIHQQAFVISDLAQYSERLGEKPTQLYEQAAALGARCDDSLLQLGALNDLVQEYLAKGQLQAAQAASRSESELSRTLHNSVLLSKTQRDAGEIALASGKPEIAIRDFNQSLRNATEGNGIYDQILSYLQLGKAFQATRRLPEARDAFHQAETLSITAKDPTNQAEALYNLAIVDEALNHHTAALDEIQHAVQLTESIRNRVGSQNAKTNWFSTVHQYYGLQIHLLTRPGATEQDIRHAFDVSEAVRSRTLLELLNRARTTADDGKKPTLFRRETQVDEAVSELNKQEVDALANGSSWRRLKLASHLARLASEQDSLLNELDQALPNADTVAPTSNSQAAQQLLRPDDLLLEYALGADHSYVWAVTSTQIRGYALAPARQISSAVQFLRSSIQQPCASGLCEAAKTRKIQQTSRRVSELLLAPVGPLLEKTHVVIAPEGDLTSLPFALLPVAKTSSVSEPLIQSHTLSYVPSASTLQAIRERPHAHPPASRSVLVFADPIFESDDPRLLRQTSTSGNPAGPVSELPARFAVVASHSPEIPRLPATRQEAMAIAAAAPAGSTRILMGFDANLDAALSPELSNYRILHFATHSIYDPAKPGSSGILLSLYNHNGKSRDGYLTVRKISSLNLSSDLVVLSACNTALGPQVQGEGVVGLARAFIFAGASRVGTTLWKVDDDATSEFMRLFYIALLQHQQPPAEALRTAQLALMHQPRWHSPVYWAGFVIEGDQN